MDFHYFITVVILVVVHLTMLVNPASAAPAEYDDNYYDLLEAADAACH